MSPTAAPRNHAHHRYAVQMRLMRWGKYLLPVVAVGLGVAIFYLARVEARKNVIPIGASTEVIPEEIDSVSMTNARFSGRDSRNRSFTVTAEEARQRSSDSTIIHLKHPKADLDLTGGRLVAIHADSGIYVRNDQLLNLAGEVTLSDNRGFEFHTDSASIDLGRNTASGDAPVAGRGPSGDITSEGFRVLDDGDRILFTGMTSLTLTVAGNGDGSQSNAAETP
ncbi:MAG TPA: LPS export ABC transporter periplasmic protein LptC [Dongiaceae bacterium]